MLTQYFAILILTVVPQTFLYPCQGIPHLFGINNLSTSSCSISVHFQILEHVQDKHIASSRLNNYHFGTNSVAISQKILFQESILGHKFTLIPSFSFKFLCFSQTMLIIKICWKGTGDDYFEIGFRIQFVNVVSDQLLKYIFLNTFLNHFFYNKKVFFILK